MLVQRVQPAGAGGQGGTHLSAGLGPQGQGVRAEDLRSDGRGGIEPLAEPLELAPGDHTIEVRADGYLPFRKSATFAERQRATVELDDLRKPKKTKAWIALGVAGAGVAAGSIFGVLALNKRTEYDDLAAQRGIVTEGMNIDPELDSVRSSGKRNSLLSDIGFGVGLVALGASIYWFATEGKGLSGGEIVVTPMGVAGRF